jgi:CDP-diacylglycerol--glycerol-3-phosphate 3-phosphatidyltransferase
MVNKEFLNVPTILTLIRLVVSPLLLPILLVAFLPQNSFYINSALAALFVFLGLTDFFDGYLARRLGQETQFGKVLDPMADKSLVYATLVALLAIHKIYFYWVVLLIGRDFFMMGLRQIALENGFAIRVSSGGRVKTVVQMACLAFIIANPYQALGIAYAPIWNGAECFLLALTLVMAIASAVDYFNVFAARWQQE